MKTKFFFCLAVLFSSFTGKSQVIENFTDGDITNNPAWIGNTIDWIINPSFQLQSNNTTPNSTFYISTASTMVTTTQWDFFSQISFNPSSANYIDVFLIASASDLTQSTTTGYFVRIGNSTDEISLYRKDAGSITKIIDGIDGILNTSNNAVKIKVTRNAGNQWNLSRDLNGTGLTSEGVITDATYLMSSYFGILVKQSTAGFFQRHYFDDIIVSMYVPDTTAPLVQTYTATSENTLDLLFNEPVDIISAESVANYFVNNGIGFPVSAIRDVSNAALVHLTFAITFPLRTNLQILINAVKDLPGNAINNLSGMFSYFIPFQYDVIIDELMADPTPLVGLPDNEWIELKNTTAFDINLQGWHLGKTTDESGPMPLYILKPDSFVIVCTAAAVSNLSTFGSVISVTGFPSLNNTGDLIYLRSSKRTIIHAVNYTDSWYQNELKKDGGWSLEMTDTHNPCSGFTNWNSSVDIKGGTPGKRNSVDGINPDQTSPKLLRAYARDSLNITLVFDEPLDSSKAAIISNYNISDGIGMPVAVTALSVLFDRVDLKLSRALLHNKTYTVTTTAITDCVNNTIGTTYNSARVGLVEHVDSFDIVINEILFNPSSTSNDYVELYNRSNKIINLKNVYLANRNSLSVISSITQLCTTDYLFFPEDFMVITENAALVMHDYIANNPDAFIEINMPSFNDDKGNVVIVNEQGNIIDEVAYDDKWHFALISNTEGVALERISYDAVSQNPQNWHSAASNVNYGTPTYKNSQSKTSEAVEGEIKVSPEIISPDNDGIDNFATIDYSFPEPGYVANMIIFDAAGRLVRNLQRNVLCGIKGYYRWDGLGEKNQKLPVGIYIIYIEVFNLDGKTKKFKYPIVLARK